MTVAELIEKLKELPQDRKVITNDGEVYDIVKIVDFNKSADQMEELILII